VSEPIERLRGLDRAIARRGASADARARVRRRIRQSAVERRFHVMLRWWPAAAFAAGAVMMGVLLIPDREVSSGRGTSTAVVEGAEVGATDRDASGERRSSQSVTAPSTAPPTDPTCADLRSGAVELAADACAFAEGVRITALLPSRLRWEASKAEVQSGELLFDVAPRPERPLHVTLGAVDIEVVGTRFVVHHGGTHRWISMLEGHVRTRVGDGAAQDLRDGQRLDWPSPTASTITPTPARPTTRPIATSKPPKPDDGVTSLLDRVAALRRDGAFREAVELLRSTDTHRWSPRARQLVSYEIGTLLERQLGDVEQACVHWTEHRRRFPNGRHDAIVARSLDRLRCDTPE
jgi:hypothetical protein